MALTNARALKVVEKIISGDILEEIGTTDDGKPIYGATKNRDRLEATRFLAGYAFGQPVQHLVDDTPRDPLVKTTAEILAAIPRLLDVMAVPQPERMKLLQAVSVDATVVA